MDADVLQLLSRLLMIEDFTGSNNLSVPKCPARSM